MQSEAQLMMGISRGVEPGASAGSRPEEKENSGAAGAFLELFSGSLAQSYQNDTLATRETRFAERTEPAVEARPAERSESERNNKRFEVERSERNDRDRTDRSGETRRNDAADRSRNDRVNTETRAEATERKTAQTRSENTGETKQRTEAANSEPRDKAVKNGVAAQNQATEGKRAAKSDTQAKALANLMSGAAKSESSEAVSKQVEQLVKTSTKVAQQATKPAAQQNVTQASTPTPEAAVAAKNAATAKVAESGAKHVDANTARPNAVQGAEAPKNNAQTGGEQQTGNNNTGPSGVNAAANQDAARLAQQHNRNFSTTLKEAAQNNAVNKTGASTQTNGSQVALSNAAGQYSRAATHVFNAPKAQAPAQAQPSQVISQLIRAAKISMQNGREEMKILLKPEQLGWLKVKITVEGGRVTAHFGAENEFVRGVLEGNISQLQQALQNNNLRVNQIQIDVAGQQNQNQNPQSGAAGDNAGNDKNTPGNDSDVADAHSEESTVEELYYLQDTAALELSAVDVRI